MKSLLLSFALIIAFSSSFVGCTPRQATDEDTEVRGISADTGYDRNRIYDWQDETFRRLAY